MSAEDQSFRMWNYMRDKHGVQTAAAEYYPNAFRNDPSLARALAMIEDGKALIEKRMAELAEQEFVDEQP